MKIRTKTIISITGAFLLLSFGLGITYYSVSAKRLRMEAEKKPEPDESELCHSDQPHSE